MLKRSLLIFGLLLIGTFGVYAQSQCNCSLGSCSTSQSCPAGFIAVCTCSATGCSSECKKESGDLNDRIDPNGLIKTLSETDSKNIGNVLSKTFGKFISFEPAAKGFKFDYAPSKTGTRSHWEIFEFLRSKGTLKINGHDLEFWQGIKETLLNGGEFNLCFEEASVRMILNHLSFLSGKKLSIAGGDGQAKISGPLQGNNLSEILENLSKLGHVKIVEN